MSQQARQEWSNAAMSPNGKSAARLAIGPGNRTTAAERAARDRLNAERLARQRVLIARFRALGISADPAHLTEVRLLVSQAEKLADRLEALADRPDE